MYTIMLEHFGRENIAVRSMAAAKRYFRENEGWDRVYLAPSYEDDQGREVWEVFASLRELREHPDGDPYAPAIRREVAMKSRK